MMTRLTSTRIVDAWPVSQITRPGMMVRMHTWLRSHYTPPISVSWVNDNMHMKCAGVYLSRANWATSAGLWRSYLEFHFMMGWLTHQKLLTLSSYIHRANGNIRCTTWPMDAYMGSDDVNMGASATLIVDLNSVMELNEVAGGKWCTSSVVNDDHDGKNG